MDILTFEDVSTVPAIKPGSMADQSRPQGFRPNPEQKKQSREHQHRRQQRPHHGRGGRNPHNSGQRHGQNRARGFVVKPPQNQSQQVRSRVPFKKRIISSTVATMEPRLSVMRKVPISLVIEPDVVKMEALVTRKRLGNDIFHVVDANLPEKGMDAMPGTKVVSLRCDETHDYRVIEFMKDPMRITYQVRQLNGELVTAWSDLLRSNDKPDLHLDGPDDIMEQLQMLLGMYAGFHRQGEVQVREWPLKEGQEIGLVGSAALEEMQTQMSSAALEEPDLQVAEN